MHLSEIFLFCESIFFPFGSSSAQHGIWHIIGDHNKLRPLCIQYTLKFKSSFHVFSFLIPGILHFYSKLPEQQTQIGLKYTYNLFIYQTILCVCIVLYPFERALFYACSFLCIHNVYHSRIQVLYSLQSTFTIFLQVTYMWIIVAFWVPSTGTGTEKEISSIQTFSLNNE